MSSSMRSGGVMAQRLVKTVTLSSLSLVLGSSAVAQLASFEPPRSDERLAPCQTQASSKNKMPPDISTSPRAGLSAARVEQEIQKRIRTNPAMATANVTARVNDSSVVLSGTVDSSRQHDLALLIAHSWAGQRKVVDQIKRRM